MKVKICKKCGKEYISIGSNQKYCKECSLIARKEYMKQYSKQWGLEYLKYIKEQAKQYYKIHLEQRKEYDKQYRKTHLDQKKKYNRQYCEVHLKQKKKYDKQYRQTEKGKIVQKKYHAKRREFDFIPLNSYHKGWNFHHLDEIYGIYIPEDIHKSIRHSVLKNINMDEINALAMNYL